MIACGEHILIADSTTISHHFLKIVDMRITNKLFPTKEEVASFDTYAPEDIGIKKD